MPSPPSPNPVAPYRWEDSSSLGKCPVQEIDTINRSQEHSCWACPTKANSPKALHSCYGIHSVPCLAYHSTMHALGGSHRCSACATSREMHDARHREIAELVADYHAADPFATITTTRIHTLVERPVNLPAPPIHERPRDIPYRVNGYESDGENVSVTDSTVSTATSSDTSIPKLSKAEQRENKKAKKAAKSQNKAAKNQARHVVNITSEAVAAVGLVLHGDETDNQTKTHPLATDTAIEEVIDRNKGFVNRVNSHHKILQQTVRIGRMEDKERRRAKRLLVEGFEDIELEAVVDAVLIKLGVKVNPKHNHSQGNKLNSSTSNSSSPAATGKTAGEIKKSTKTQAAIIQKLREAIKADFEKHENDMHQRLVRAGGFFRYVGRTVFERMTDVARTIDMQTGEEWEKKRKREAIVESAAAERQFYEHEEGENDLE